MAGRRSIRNCSTQKLIQSLTLGLQSDGILLWRTFRRNRKNLWIECQKETRRFEIYWQLISNSPRRAHRFHVLFYSGVSGGKLYRRCQPGKTFLPSHLRLPSLLLTIFLSTSLRTTSRPAGRQQAKFLVLFNPVFAEPSPSSFRSFLPGS